MSLSLDTNFKFLSDGDFILKLNSLADVCDGHPAYKGGVPECIPGGPQFRECAEQLTHAVAAAERDKAKEGEKVAVRAKGERKITHAAQFLVMYSYHNDDPTLLHNVGLELKHKAHSSGSKALPKKPSKFRVTNGKVSGGIVALSNNGFGKGSIELQITDGDPTDEARWRTLDFFYGCKMEVNGLEPVKKYHFRSRFRNAAGYGPWSEIVVLVVI